MILKADSKTYFIFDLDDTLYSEISYLRSAFREIAMLIEPESHEQLFLDMYGVYCSGANTFSYLTERFHHKKINTEILLYLYRNHVPVIRLREGVTELLEKIKFRKGRIGLITNGRSITQRNKIRALGLDQFLDEVLISEEFGNSKPDISLFNHFHRMDSMDNFVFFGDNPEIDFVSPKRLSWFCVGINDIENIHRKEISEFSDDYLPDVFIKNFTEIEII